MNFIGHMCRNSHRLIVTFLLQEAHCDPNCVAHDGKTPLDLIYNPELIRLLLSSGAEPTTSCFPRHLQDNQPTWQLRCLFLVTQVLVSAPSSKPSALKVKDSPE